MFIVCSRTKRELLISFAFVSVFVLCLVVPLPTYFFCDKSVHPAELSSLEKEGGALCHNLFYLGGEAGIKQICGLSIAFFARDCADCQSTLISLAEARSTASKNALLSKSFVTAGGGAASDSGSGGGGGVDILLTNTVPFGVTNHTSNPDIFSPQTTAYSFRVTNVVRAVRPRYHFSGGAQVFWGRPPYRNEAWSGAGSRHFFTTRYYSLAPFGNENNQRFMFAAAVQPIATMQHEDTPADVTDSPYIAVRAPSSDGPGLRRPRDDEAPAGDDGNYRQNLSFNKRRQRPKGPYFVHDSDSCWFCLSNPSVEKHLIVHTGNHCYVSVAKGPICPGHMLVVPCHHVPSTAAFSRAGPEDGPAALSEVLTTIRAVARCLLDISGPFHASAVLAFERFIPSTVTDRRTGREKEIHAHGLVHVVPLPLNADLAGIPTLFEVRGASSGAVFEPEDWLQTCTTRAAKQQDGGDDDDRFFWYRVMTAASMDAEEEEGYSSFAVQCAHGVGKNMHINFGRYVACCIAHMIERNDWHRCVLPKEQEEEQAKACRDALLKYLPGDGVHADDDDGQPPQEDEAVKAETSTE